MKRLNSNPIPTYMIVEEISKPINMHQESKETGTQYGYCSIFSNETAKKSTKKIME